MPQSLAGATLGAAAGMPNGSQIGEKLDLCCLSTMQHYGVPTRLLDWTSTFWTSVYFACAGDPAKDAELWIYDRDRFKFAAETLARSAGLDVNIFQEGIQDPPLLARYQRPLLVEFTKQLTPRMTQQQGYHTVATDVFADHAPLLYEILHQPPAAGSIPGSTPEDSPEGFFRVIIAGRCRDKVIKHLNDYKKVSASTLFPDIEGLGRFLRWQLDSLVTACF